MARSQAEESFAIFRQLDDKRAIAGLLLHLGALAADQGEYSKALTLLEESLAINRALADKSGTADSLFNLARASYFSGDDLARARILLEESFAIFTELGDKESLAYCLCLSGLLALEQGDTTSAYSLIEQSVALFKERRQKHGMALSTTSLAKVTAAQGDTTTARVLYEESVLLAMKADDKLNIASALEGLASVVATQGAYTWAARLWGAAKALREMSGAPIAPRERPAYESSVTAARAHLGERPFAIVWAEGRLMTAEQTLAARESLMIPTSLPTESSTRLAKPATTYPDGLTTREVEVLRLLTQGLTDVQIAEQLVISPRTVNNHLTSIYGKIQVASRSAATRYALEHHLA